METIKCAWCGGEYPLTKKGKPKQHRNGKTTCVGSGQDKATHDRLRKAAEDHQKELSK